MIQMLFAMFVFAFLGLASLTVDHGMARLTHLQMRNGVEAAAMEGLRMTDAAPTELERRSAARDFMLWVYDDDFDPASGDAMQHGAGPLYDLEGGTPGANALQKLSIPDPPVYLPDLQLNLSDEVHGDMVSGRYLPWDLEHHESASYARTDFYGTLTILTAIDELIAAVRALNLHHGTENSLLTKLERAAEKLEDLSRPGNLNSARAGLRSFIAETGAQSGKHIPAAAAEYLIAMAEEILALLEAPVPDGIPAFLVRLRRTRDPTNPEVVVPIDAEEGVSSSGPALSYLFGRGSLIDNSRRHDGVKVRATAIAAAQPAISVGRAAGVLGATQFAIEYDFWNTMGSRTVVLRTDDDDDDDDDDEDVRGFWVDSRAWSIGNIVTRREGPSGPVQSAEVYVIIFAELDRRRVVGFGIVETFPHPHGVRIRRRSGAIAPANASAAVAPGLAGFSDALLRAVLDRNRALSQPLLAPVLVR